MRLGPFFALVLLAGAGAAGWYWLNNQAPETARPAGGGGRRAAMRSDGPVPVTVDAVRKENVPIYREGIGNVQALYTVTVRAQIDGRLLSVDFTEGQNVRKGDVLARIDPSTYKAQYDQAVAKKAQDTATLSNARLDLQRYQNLAQSNAGPKQQADQQAAVVAQLEAQIKADEAAIDNAKAVLDYTTIVSPIDGRAGLRQVDAGNIIHASDSSGLVSLTQVNPIAAIFTLPQRDLPAISAALARGEVPVEVLSSGSNDALARGTLQTVDNQIDVSTGTIKLKAVFPNEAQKLWPGQFISVRVVVDTLVDAKVVATPAVRRGPSGTFLYVVGADDKAAVRPVEVVTQDETRAVIGKGVEAGERVVTVGFAQLSDGKAVLLPGAAPAAASPDASARPRGNRRQNGEARRDNGEPKAEGSGSGERRHRRREGAGTPENAPPAAPAAAPADGAQQSEAGGTREVAR